MHKGLQFPMIFILPAHLRPEQLRELEDSVPTTTSNINEAEVILGNISRRERALFELRRRKVVFEIAPTCLDEKEPGQAKHMPTTKLLPAGNLVNIARIEWLSDSLKNNQLLPIDGYLILSVYRKSTLSPQVPRETNAAFRSRARANRRLPEGEQSSLRKRPCLLQKSTSEDADLPQVPDFLHLAYSCQRPTPSDPPNAPFIEQLVKIRKQRILTGDHVGVRAYSTSIASLSAYPHHLQSPHGK